MEELNKKHAKTLHQIVTIVATNVSGIMTKY